MNTHEQYEELCALAASGQASPTELDDLRSHLEGCPSCRSAAYDFTQISSQGLAQIAAKRQPCEIPSRMTQRFIARARTEGIEMSREKVAPKAKPRRIGVLAFSAAAGLLFASVLLWIGQHRERTVFRPKSSAGVPVPGPVHSASEGPNNPNNKDAQRRQELDSARSQIASMRTTIQAQQGKLDRTDQEQSLLSLRAANAERERSRLQSEKEQLETKIAALEANLEKAKTDKNTNDAVIALQETELHKLQSQLADQNVALDQQEELAARGSEVRALVVARNLHIIDVHDRDGDGKNQRAFGRIFYTEGKSLIFYAYDLADPQKLDAKVSFYVWGERLGSEKPIKSLGVLHSDDTKEGRWILTFDDPQVLAKINSVFVTAESTKKSIKEPGGKRILFAFLGDKPNHP